MNSSCGSAMLYIQMWRVFDQEGDWGKLLAMFARVAEGASA
jgi:hypothetical protein